MNLIPECEVNPNALTGTQHLSKDRTLSGSVVVPLALTSWALCCSSKLWKFPEISDASFSSVWVRNSIQVSHFSRKVWCCSRKACSLLQRKRDNRQ